MKSSNGISIRPYTHKELAFLYRVSWNTFQKWLRPIENQLGPKKGHFYSAQQVRLIFSSLGMP